MSWLTTRAAIVSAILNKDTGLTPRPKTCEPHGGRLTLADIKRYSLRAPAILVSLIGGTTKRQSGTQVTPRQWAAFIITRGTSGVNNRRDAEAIVLAQALSLFVDLNNWGDDDNKRPEDIRDDNLYSIELDKQGIALWVVAWQQDYDIEPDASALDAFVSLYGDWDMAPQDAQIDMQSKTTLEQP